MSTLELKRLLIEKIQKIEDDNLLGEAYRLLEINAEESDEVYLLNDEQKSAIEEAREQIRNGQYLTNEESNRQIKEWLKK